MVITVGIILLLRKAGHLAVEKIDQSHRMGDWAWLFFCGYAGCLAINPASKTLPADPGVLTLTKGGLSACPKAIIHS